MKTTELFREPSSSGSGIASDDPCESDSWHMTEADTVGSDSLDEAGSEATLILGQIPSSESDDN